jgi:hypothetical protein
MVVKPLDFIHQGKYVAIYSGVQKLIATNIELRTGLGGICS